MHNRALKDNKKTKKRSQIYQKLIITLFSLLLFRVGNLLPLPGIDRLAIEEAFSNVNENGYLIKALSMYSSGGSFSINVLSLGIIPYINASILIDLLATAVKPLEKLQEEGESGKKKLNFYKKILSFLISGAQSIALLLYFKDYFYDFNVLNVAYLSSILITGSMITIYITNKIDSKGIGNGTSLIIFTNIVLSFFRNQTFLQNYNFKEFILLLIFLLFITILQKVRINIPLVSARQLAFLQEGKKSISKSLKLKKEIQFDENGLSIKFNQAGIFPIIIASNLMPFFSFLDNSFSKLLTYFLYNFFIVSFNYFYTLLFWDPEKISKQLSKASVSIVNIRPGKETLSYLQNIVKSSSLVGGLALSMMVVLYDLSIKYFHFLLLGSINVSSLIILTGVAFEIQKSICSLYQSLQDESIEKI